MATAKWRNRQARMVCEELPKGCQVAGSDRDEQ